MLTPDKVRYENGVKINEKLMPDNLRATKTVASWVTKGSLMKPNTSMNPIGITIHNTSDLKNVNDDAEQYVRATYNEHMGGVVVHYYVDDLGAWQLLREDEPGWHAADGSGNGNRRTIAIECIMDGSRSPQDLKARDNTARLAASILKRHNWTLDNVYTHNHWMKLPDEIVKGARKNCPVYLLPDWSGFKTLIKSYMSNPVNSVITPTTSNPNTTDHTAGIKVGNIMLFSGTFQYRKSLSTAGIPAPSGRVKVTSITKKPSPHPIHVRSIDESGKFVSGAVYGWVDTADLEPIESTPYKVKVTASKLNVRSGPGVLNKVTYVINGRGVYTITDEKSGWGKLSSGKGWINLKYTTKI